MARACSPYTVIAAAYLSEALPAGGVGCKQSTTCCCPSNVHVRRLLLTYAAGLPAP